MAQKMFSQPRAWEPVDAVLDGRREQSSPVPGNGRFGGLQKEKAEEDRLDGRSNEVHGVCRTTLWDCCVWAG